MHYPILGLTCHISRLLQSLKKTEPVTASSLFMPLTEGKEGRELVCTEIFMGAWPNAKTSNHVASFNSP